MRRSVENAAAAIAFAVAGMSSCRPGLRRPDRDLAGRRDLEAGVLRLARHGRREALEVLLGPAPGDRDVGAAPRGQREQRCDPPAWHPPARLAVGEAQGGRERRARLRRGRLELVGADARLGRSKRERDRRAAVEARERPHDDDRGGLAVEPAAGPALDDTNGETLAHELGVDARDVDRAGDLVELVGDRSVVGLDRRRDVDPEEARAQALEATHGPEAPTLGRGGLDRSAPVGLDPELRRREGELLAAGGERERLALDRRRTRGEPAHRLAFREAADVDAGHRRSRRQRHPRPREGKPDEHARAAREQPSERRPGAGQSGGGIGAGARGGGRSSCRCAPNR